MYSRNGAKLIGRTVFWFDMRELTLLILQHAFDGAEGSRTEGHIASCLLHVFQRDRMRSFICSCRETTGNRRRFNLHGHIDLDFLKSECDLDASLSHFRTTCKKYA